MHDTFRGIVPLPDGRQCKAVLRGMNHNPTFWEPGYFEEADDALEIEELDGELDDDDVEFCIGWLVDHGEFEEYVDEPY